MKRIAGIGLFTVSVLVFWTARADCQENLADLPRLTPGKAGMENALWIENDLSRQFSKSSAITIAEIKGPATITMIHFALPAAQVMQPTTGRLNRDLLLKIYWDGETEPSVNCPLVDFFCDPAGLRDEVNTLLVTKRRGWNAYFPMPFRRSAKVELVYEGSLPPGQKLWEAMPAYSYVMYRAESIPADAGYFHAHWRQSPFLAGKEEYVALDAKGKGKFVGWNVTIRRPGGGDYLVDVNEKFFVDGEKEASVEFQGLEDCFGFSYGFPETPSQFPRTGYFPFLNNGAAAYRFFTQDAVSFEKSLRLVIGLGPKDAPMFLTDYSKPETTMQFSSTVYWYQDEPHAAFPPMPPANERAPAPASNAWLKKETLPK